MARGSAASTIPRYAAMFGLFVLFCGYVVITAGLAKIQKTTNALGPAAQIPADTATQYVNTFTQSLITPYPAQHGFQFAFIWFIIHFNLLNWVIVLGICAVPRVAFVGRNAALALLAICTTLTINVVNNLQFMHKSAFAVAAYGKRDIDVTFAGSLLVVLGDFFIILALGVWEHDRNVHSVDNPHYDTHKRTGEPAVATTTAV